MAEGWDLKKFYADMVENMPVLEIRRKMEDDKKLKKFADFQNCTHIAFDKRKLPDDRELEIFSDDLFKYLLFRRLNVKEYLSELQRTPADPISNFHPHIGMSVLCCSYRTQKYTFMEILESKLEIKNLDAIARYLTHKTLSLRSSVQYDVFYKLILLASITIELSAFLYLRGHKNAVYYGARLYFSAFRNVFKKDFYASGGWKVWQNTVVEDVVFYVENLLEVEDLGTEEAITVCRWLSRFDRWIARFSLNACSQTESTLANNESGNLVNVHDATLNSEKTPIYANSRADEERLKCLSLKDCPAVTKFRNRSTYLLLDLIEIIDRQKDSTSEELFQILENGTYVKELMRYCIFFTIIINLRASKIKLRNIDILQCVKQILRGDALLATYCLIMNELFKEIDQSKSVTQKDADEKILDKAAEILNPLENTNTNIESVKNSSPIKKISCSLHENKKLLDSFHHKIKSGGQLCTSAAATISEILSNKGKEEILLRSPAFKVIMKTTMDCPKNRWDDEWILSVMTLLINTSQTKDVLMDQTTVNGGEKNKYLANEVSSVHINPQLIKSVPCSVPKTAHSSLPSTSKLENTEIEHVCTDDVTELVKNPHQSECRECFNRVNEKLRLVKYDSTIVDEVAPSSEISSV